MDAQTMYERGQPIDNHEEGGPAPAPSPHFIIDEEGRKWYPFTVPHAAGFTIDYSLDPNPTAVCCLDDVHDGRGAAGREAAGSGPPSPRQSI